MRTDAEEVYMTPLPAWVNSLKCDDVLLREALAIAWGALESIDKSGSQQRPKFKTPNAEICSIALRRIEELGK